MTKNPFINRRPVYGQEHFNRKDDIKYILDYILADNPQSVSIVSQQRMGASSLLHHICKYAGPAQKADALFIYLDMQSIQTRESYFNAIIKKMGEGGSDYEHLDDALHALNKRHIIICLDHFDKVLTKPVQFDVDFFDFMRSLISADHCLAFVLVTSKPLAQLNLPYKPGGSSPLKNIYQSQRVLQNWGIIEQRTFIRDGFSKSGMSITEEEIKFITDHAGESPYHLTVLLDHYFRARVKNYVNHRNILKSYQEDVKGVSESKIKMIGELAYKHGWKMFFTIVSVAVLFLWGTYGIPRSSASYKCETTGAEKFSVFFEYPKYLSEGDSGSLNFTIRNESGLSIDPVVVLVNFTNPIQMLPEYSNRTEFKNLDNGEQRSSEIKFRLTRPDKLVMSAQVVSPERTIPCEPMNPAQTALILAGPIPYLMTAWVWLGTTGPIGWFGPLLVEWLKKKVIKNE